MLVPSLRACFGRYQLAGRLTDPESAEIADLLGSRWRAFELRGTQDSVGADIFSGMRPGRRLRPLSLHARAT